MLASAKLLVGALLVFWAFATSIRPEVSISSLISFSVVLMISGAVIALLEVFNLFGMAHLPPPSTHGRQGWERIGCRIKRNVWYD